jgi:hypothetical protein
MVQKLNNLELLECYQDVLSMGIVGLKDLEQKHILQLKSYAEHLYFEGVKFCMCMTQAGIKNLPEGITEENELQYYIEKSESTQSPLYVLKIIESYFQKNINDNSKAEKEPPKEKSGITLVLIGYFCGLIKKSGVFPKGERESVESFCKKVCEKFVLDYTDNVRKAFTERMEKDKTQKVIKHILPIIDITTSEKITKYINENQKLYG